MKKCYRCEALYNEKTKWLYGYEADRKATTDTFVPLGRVEEGHCPICMKPPLEEPPRTVSAM